MRTLFSLSAALTALLGVSWLLVPTRMLALWGVQGDAVALYMSRRYAGMYFGYSVILWLVRTAPASQGRTAVLAGGLVVTSMMALLSLAGVLSGTIGPAGWSAVFIEGLLAASFGYFCSTSR